MSKRKRIVPNVIRGGAAIPLGANYFYMNGKKHEQGGIDIGKDLEVEGGEIIKVENDGMKILSDAPIMNGVSPAQMALGGLQDGTFTERFKEGFKYQENYKDKNGLKDDGTKAKFGRKKKVIGGEEFAFPKIYERQEDVFYELDEIVKNAKSDKELVSQLDAFWNNVKDNISLSSETLHGLEQDINHYKQYPYSSIILTRDNYDRMDKENKDMQFRIPAEYSKLIKLSNAGKSTGTHVTTNMLDSLAYRGGRAKADSVRVLGVPAQETTLGKFNGTTYLTPREIRDDDFYYSELKGEYPEVFIREGGVYPTQLMNNHSYYANSADQEAIGAISRKFGVGHDTSNGNTIAEINYNDITPEIEKAFKETFRYTSNKRSKENKDVHPLEQAYVLDATGNYNLGITNHNELVEQRGRELWESPEIQKWWKESGKAWYEKGKSETKKLGGKANMKQTRRDVPSTGGRKKAYLGESIVYGVNKLNLPTFSPYATILNPQSGIKIQYNNTSAPVQRRTDFQPLEEVISIAPESATTSFKDPGLAPVSGWTKGVDNNFTKHSQAGNNQVSFLQANPNFLGNIVNAGANIIGSTISYFNNRNMLKDLEAPKVPYALQPTKFKTNINIRPQVQQLRRTIDKYNKFLDRNTASSQTAVGRRRLNELSYLEGHNQLYGAKENQETQLINQDRANQQEVAKYNLENYNNWLDKSVAFNNQVREAQSENTQNYIQNLSGTFGNFLNNERQWQQSMANIAALSAAYPDVTPELMNSKGLPYALWLQQRNARRAAKKNKIG